MSALVVTTRRTLHPGKPRPQRVATAVGRDPRRVISWLAEGETLRDALLSVYIRFGVRAGALYLLGGRLSTAAYHVAAPSRDSLRVIEYGPPIFIEGGADIVCATGSFGDDLSGGPLLHIHGLLVETSGRAHGGHISPDLCVVGSGGVRALIMLALGFKQVLDPETRFSLFLPYSEEWSNGSI